MTNCSRFSTLTIRGYAAFLLGACRWEGGNILRLWSRIRACTTLGLNCLPEHAAISCTAAAMDRRGR